MALFASLTGGDIWSLSGISFMSPINDLLDRGSFTLEELLKEDEVLQEVKTKNQRLMEFLCTEESINKLLYFVITPATSEDDDARRYRYPYMSCELICCEVPEILSILVEARDGLYLDRLFEFLTNPAPLDCYLAGYFEKILEMLFRKMTTPMMCYLNEKGLSLFELFLSHVSNYSIMQIIQRLLLPHLPFSVPETEAVDDPHTTEVEFDVCNWSFTVDICGLLLHRLLSPSEPDETLHISDMLITVLQLSPPDTLVIKFLCHPSSIRALFLVATGEKVERETERETDPEAEKELTESTQLAAISVLESLLSRLFEVGFPFQPGAGEGGSGEGAGDVSGMSQEVADSEQIAMVHEYIRQVCEEMAPLLERLNEVLVRLIPHRQTRTAEQDNAADSAADGSTDADKTQDVVSLPSKIIVPRLGHLGLQSVKLIEALVRLGSYEIDSALIDCSLLQTCLSLFIAYEYHSVLHLSVQRICITILEAPAVRAALQAHLCGACGLLQVMMLRVARDIQPAADIEQSGAAGGGESQTPFQQLTSTAGRFVFSARHCSLVGHLILMTHAAHLLLSGKELQTESEQSAATAAQNASAQNAQSGGQDAVGGESLGVSREASESETESAVEASDDGSRGMLSDVVSQTDAESRVERATHLRSLISDATLLTHWDDFITTRFSALLEQQQASMSAPGSANTSLSHQHHALHHQTALMLQQHAPTLHLQVDAVNVSLEDDDDDEDDEDEDFVGRGRSRGEEERVRRERLEEVDLADHHRISHSLSQTQHFGADVFEEDLFAQAEVADVLLSLNSLSVSSPVSSSGSVSSLDVSVSEHVVSEDIFGDFGSTSFDDVFPDVPPPTPASDHDDNSNNTNGVHPPVPPPVSVAVDDFDPFGTSMPSGPDDFFA